MSLFIIIITTIITAIAAAMWTVFRRLGQRTQMQKLALIKLHNDHIYVIIKQRDLYRSLLDTFIEQHMIVTPGGTKQVNWCGSCQQPSLVVTQTGDVICKLCKESKI